MDLCEFEASLAYRAGSRTAKATQGKLVSLFTHTHKHTYTHTYKINKQTYAGQYANLLLSLGNGKSKCMLGNGCKINFFMTYDQQVFNIYALYICMSRVS